MACLINEYINKKLSLWENYAEKLFLSRIERFKVIFATHILLNAMIQR